MKLGEKTMSKTFDHEMFAAATALGADSEMSDVEFAFPAQAEVVLEELTLTGAIVLSDRDFERFEKIMAADSEPTELAMRGAAEFRTGKIEGSRYYW